MQQMAQPQKEEEEEYSQVIDYETLMRDYARSNPSVYFSQSVLNMLREGVRCQPTLYRDRYVLRTPLHDQEHIRIFVEFFKRKIGQHITATEINAYMPNFSEVAVELKVSVEDLENFYKALSVRVACQLPTFIGLTADGLSMGFHDLIHYKREPVVTIDACNACNASESSKTKKRPVFTCVGCHRAAYCNRECQKDDWVFHKQYCRFFKEAQESDRVEEVSEL